MKFGEELIKMEKELKNIQNDQHSLAYELILESKKKAKRNFVVILVLAIMLFGSNMIWLYFLNQYDLAGEETTIDSGNREYLEKIIKQNDEILKKFDNLKEKTYN